MKSPYRIEGPATISFSGGRTSGYLLKHILDAHGGALPDDVKVTFQNTGKEKPQTLDFIQECASRWGVHINWLEYRNIDGEHSFEVVSHNSASRNGEPFDQLLSVRPMLPYPRARFCSAELKIRTSSRWVQSTLGWDQWTNVIGLRADEPTRVAKAKQRVEGGKEPFDVVVPLFVAGVTKRHVSDFWQSQPFDLKLLNIKGTTPDGNCDNCFMKKLSTIHGRARRDPESFAWWIAKESERKAAADRGEIKPIAAVFRKDRPTYAQILKYAQDQGDMVGDAEDDDEIDCACTD